MSEIARQMQDPNTFHHWLHMYPCHVCAVICAQCRGKLRISESDIIDLLGYSDEDVSHLEEKIKACGLAWSLGWNIATHEDEGDK